MAKVSKDMLIGQLLQIDANIAPILMKAGMHCPEYCTNSFKYWYALSWMPIFPDGISRRSGYGSWTGC